MAQTGVPFGEVAAVRDWMGIEVPVGRPPDEHPKRPVDGLCLHAAARSAGGVCGGCSRERFGSAEAFFRDHFVANYCPLVWMSDSGANLTPDKLPAAEMAPVEEACRDHLAGVITVLRPDFLVGIGAYAEGKLAAAAESTGCAARDRPGAAPVARLAGRQPRLGGGGHETARGARGVVGEGRGPLCGGTDWTVGPITLRRLRTVRGGGRRGVATGSAGRVRTPGGLRAGERISGRRGGGLRTPGTASLLAQQVPRGDQRLQAGHFDRRIDAGAPEEAAVVVLQLDVGRGGGVGAAAHGVGAVVGDREVLESGLFEGVDEGVDRAVAEPVDRRSSPSMEDLARCTATWPRSPAWWISS